jgi:predicted nucleic acid-binding protein
VDTAYLVALLDPRDRLHKAATKLTLELERDSAQLLTSDGVITEFGNYFARSPLRADASEWIHALRTDTSWLVTPMDSCSAAASADTASTSTKRGASLTA